MTTNTSVASERIIVPDVNADTFKYKLKIIIISQKYTFLNGTNELLSDDEEYVIDLPEELEDDMMARDGVHLNIVSKCSGLHIHGSERAVQYITGKNGSSLYQKLKQNYGLYYDDVSLRDSFNTLPYQLCIGKFIRSAEIIEVPNEQQYSINRFKEHNKYF